jgi:hypothetical protein
MVLLSLAGSQELVLAEQDVLHEDKVGAEKEKLCVANCALIISSIKYQ